MKPLVTFLLNLKLKNKIAALCAVLIVSMAGGTGLMFYRYSVDVLTNVSNTDSSQLVEAESNYLDEKLKALITRIYTTQADQTFNDTLLRYLKSEAPQYRSFALTYLSNLFAELRYSDPFVASVYLSTPKDGFYDLSLPIRTGFDFRSSDLYRRIEAMPEASVYWFGRAKGEIYRESGNIIPMVLRFPASEGSDDLYLVVNLSERSILDYVKGVQGSKGKATLILDRGGEIVAADSSDDVNQVLRQIRSDASVLQTAKGQLRVSSDRDRYLLAYHSMHVGPWTLVQVQSMNALLTKIEKMKQVLMLILLGCLLLGFAVTLPVSALISRPLSVLEKTMQKIRRRQFDVSFHYPYQDEVGKLGRTFNFMTAEIFDLVTQLQETIARLEEEKERVQAEQRSKQIAELKALQSQMNPHFLYNTLDSIKWMADRNGETDIGRMIASLASFFRISLSRGREIITVREELTHVESYLSIQKIRYGDSFAYRLDVEEEAFEYLTVKFILQPIVENAIYHGVKPMDRPGTIRISASIRQGCLIFRVEDDGTGVHPIKLQLLRKRLQNRQGKPSDDGYGLYNVNDRIRLICGEAYGVHIESEPGNGTAVSLVLPVMTKEEREEHV